MSLSHSGDWVLLAAAEVAVGVDVETGAVDAAVAPELLAPGEPAAELARSWVRKEAVAKLTGVGLLRPLREIRIAERTGGWSAEIDGRGYAGCDLELPVPTAVAVDAPRLRGPTTPPRRHPPPARTRSRRLSGRKDMQ